jgi:hypothetical protein
MGGRNKMDVVEVRCERVDLIQDSGLRPASVNTLINLQVS